MMSRLQVGMYVADQGARAGESFSFLVQSIC